MNKNHFCDYNSEHREGIPRRHVRGETHKGPHVALTAIPLLRRHEHRNARNLGELLANVQRLNKHMTCVIISNLHILHRTTTNSTQLECYMGSQKPTNFKSFFILSTYNWA